MILKFIVLCGLTALLPVEKDATEMLIAMSVAILMTFITLVADYVVHLSYRTKAILFAFVTTAGMQYFAPMLYLMQGQTYLPHWGWSIMMPMLIPMLLFWRHCIGHTHPIIRVQVEYITPAITVEEQTETDNQQYYENPLLYTIKAKNIRMA
jgi:hypothetical protein